MLKSVLTKVKISGLSTCLPEKVMDIFDDHTLYGGNMKRLERVSKTAGFRWRRVVQPCDNITAGDLCEFAARDLIKNMKIDVSEISACILVTQYPDYIEPSTANFIHGRLGLPKACAVFDINQGCAGYTYGLWVASMMINSGCGKVLLLVGDTPNLVTETSHSKGEDSAPMFGDGGTATLLEFDAKAAPIHFDIGSDGTGAKAIWCENGGFKNPPTADQFTDGVYQYGGGMDGLAVVDFTMREIPPSIENVIAYAGWNKADIDTYLLHQSNKMIIGNIALLLHENADKFPTDGLLNFGNLSNASIPSVMSGFMNEKLMGNPRKYIMSGYGIGLSWASVALELGNMYCPPILTYKK